MIRGFARILTGILALVLVTMVGMYSFAKIYDSTQDGRAAWLIFMAAFFDLCTLWITFGDYHEGK